MTLIASLATQDYLIQVGDTRVSVQQNDGTVRPVDDDRNKLTFFDGRMVFGYSGLAHLEGQRTDLWITRQLSHRDYSSDIEAVYALADAAAAVLKDARLSAKDKRLAIVGLGWGSESDGRAQYPVIRRLSNFYNENGAILQEARNTFSLNIWTPRHNEPYQLVLTGIQPPAKIVQKLKWKLKHHIKNQHLPIGILRLLVDFVRECANASKLIGKNLVSVYLPARARATAVRIGPEQPISISLCTTDTSGKPISLMVGGPPAEAAAFHYWPAKQKTAIMCGPNFATRNFADVMSAICQFLGPISHLATGHTEHQPAHYDESSHTARPWVRFELIPSKRRISRGEKLSVDCVISGLGDRQEPALGGFTLVVLWNVNQLEFRNVAFGTELGGEANSTHAYNLLEPGAFNPDDPEFAAVILNERTSLDPTELIRTQSASPRIARLEFVSLTSGPIRLNAGFPNAQDSLLDAHGRPSLQASVCALFLNQDR